MVPADITRRGPSATGALLPHHQAVSSRIVVWKFSLFFVATKKVTSKVMAFQHCIYTCFVCLCVWEKRRIYKGRETGEAIKSLAFTLTVLPTKNVTRLGAAEVPADRETSVVSLSFEPLRGPPLSMFSLSLPM